MKIVDSGTKLSESNFVELEKQFNIKLPYDYRAFMLRNNGGTPEGNWGFSFIETDTSVTTDSVIHYFEILYTEVTSEVDDLKAGYQALLESEQIPDTLMPIAEDPFGNIIFLGIAGADYGKVYFGNHDLEDPETGYIIMSPIAESFTNFIDNCYQINDEGY